MRVGSPRLIVSSAILTAGLFAAVAFRRELAVKGSARAVTFTGDRTARQVLQVYYER